MPRLSYSKRAAIRQAIEMQRFCYSGAELLAKDLLEETDKETRARIATGLGNLVKNWTVLQDAVRVMKGDPMPGSLRPEQNSKTKSRRAASGPLEPVPIGPK